MVETNKRRVYHLDSITNEARDRKVCSGIMKYVRYEKIVAIGDALATIEIQQWKKELPIHLFSKALPTSVAPNK